MEELSKEERLYVEQMNEWLKEQDMLDKQIERTIEHHIAMAESNKKQLQLHRERIDLERNFFNEWKEKHNIQ